MRVLRVLLRWWTASTLAALAAALWAAGRTRPVPRGRVVPDPPPGLPPARIVPVAGHGEIFVRESPAPFAGAPTVLLLHGWMFPADLHWFTSYATIARGARVLALDHRGHGRGTRPSKPFRLVDVADDAAALLGRLGTGPVIAVGYSMGGPVAQLLWQRHPELVSGMVLCATSATFNVTRADRWRWRSMGLLQLAMRLLPRHWWETLSRAIVDQRLPLQLTRFIDTELPAELDRLLPWMIAEADRGSAEDIAEAGRELSRFDARGWLPTIDVPTAVVVTLRDSLVPLPNQRDLVARLDQPTVIDLDVDHDAMIAHGDVFAPALMAAITAVDAAARSRSRTHEPNAVTATSDRPSRRTP